MNKYSQLFTGIHSEYFPYYRSWCHDIPIVITRERDRELHRLQQILYRCVSFYAEHYEDYLEIIPYEDKVLELLDYVKRTSFRAGTFRPDYVIREDGAILLCEITSRFFGNGYFMSYFMEAAGEAFASQAGVTDYRSYFDSFFTYMAALTESCRKISVIKSADKSDSIKLYVPFYQALGMEVQVLEADQVETNLTSLSDSLLISALNQKDLLSFSMDTLKRLADQGMHNDFRTVFLLHDKRFFYLLFEDAFTGKILDAEETAFLRNHVIRTYLPGKQEDVWKDAAGRKDAYILKHHCLGKSEKVYAGCLMNERDWADLFTPERLPDMILQPFISQKKFQASWQGKPLEEYLSPSILCVDDQYFGTGLFRTSSCPVINQGDAHKIAPILTDQTEKFRNCHVL